MPKRMRLCWGLLLALVVGAIWGTSARTAAAQGQQAQAGERRLLYVAVPGIRDYLEFGGHGLLVFDIDAGHKFVKRIPTAGLNPEGKPLNVKGICASALTGRVYISTTQQLQCLDLLTEKLFWLPWEKGEWRPSSIALWHRAAAQHYTTERFGLL